MGEDDAAGRRRRFLAGVEAGQDAKLITDPATWEAARALNRAGEGVAIRYHAGEIGAEEYGRGLLALVGAADEATIAAASRLLRAIEGDPRPPDA